MALAERDEQADVPPAATAETMEQHGRLDFEAEIPDKRFELDEMWTRGPGRMLGVLVCR